VSETTTIKAIAVKEGWFNSETAEATYTFIQTVATPTFTPAAGTYNSTQNVTIECETDGATIHYTTDGSEPTADSPVFSSAITVSETTTIKAIAIDEEDNASEVATVVYTWGTPAVTIHPDSRNTAASSINVTLTATPAGGTIYYTTDGSTPAPTHGTRYDKPITVDKEMTIKAIAYHKDLGASPVAEAHYVFFNKDKTLAYLTQPNPQYFAGGNDGLIDGIRGKANWRVGNWQGIQGDFEAIIDLQENKDVKRVAVSCLEDVRAWIFFPSKVEVFISDDGEHYQPFGTANGIGSEKSEEAKLHEFVVTGKSKGRYLKVKATNYGKLPDWHVSAGHQAWLFMDEIMVR
jgi:hypothetical protein